MSDPIPDDDLNELFTRQRAVDHERVPAFHTMRTRALAGGAAPSPTTSLAWRWALSGIAAFCLAMVAVLSLHHSTKTPVISHEALAREFSEIDAALEKSLAARKDLTAWQSPTDFLLHPTHHEITP